MGDNGIVSCMIPGISNNNSIGSSPQLRKGTNTNPYDLLPKEVSRKGDSLYSPEVNSSQGKLISNSSSIPKFSDAQSNY
jgi:hypothetical protein